MEKTSGNIYREHKKNRDKAVKREAETENIEEEMKQSSNRAEAEAETEKGDRASKEAKQQRQSRYQNSEMFAEDWE